jgi:hypothetical protein
VYATSHIVHGDEAEARPVTKFDAYRREEAALVHECQAAEARKYGLDDRAEGHDAKAKRHHRSAWTIHRHVNAQQRPSTPMAAPRPAHTAPRARDRRDTGGRRRSSGQDPGDDDGPSEPWALSFVDRAPFLWRTRAVSCRLLEIREGVDR